MTPPGPVAVPAAPPPRAEDLIRPAIPAPVPAPAGATMPTKPVRNFEIGVEALLRWVGIALVVLAAAFLVSTAIDRGWITREMQLMGAAIIGSAMLANAVRLLSGATSDSGAGADSSIDQFKLTRRQWATAFGNGGAVVFIVSAGAAYGWLGLWTAGTGLGLVAVAAAISLLVAMRTRLESVAITSTAAMFVVPSWARIIVDAPVAATGIWLGGFAIVALVVGLEQRWPLYRLASTVAAAAWTFGLAAALAADGNTNHRNAGLALVAVVAAVLCLGPALSDYHRRSKVPAGPMPTEPSSPTPTLAGLDYRSVMALPLWTLGSVALFAGIEAESSAGRLALALACGFMILALGTRYANVGRWLPGFGETLFASHLFGAGVLILTASVLLLDQSALVVALAGQGLATLVIGYRLNDLWLKANGMVLAAAAWLGSTGVLLDRIADGTRADMTVDVGPLLAIVVLGAFAVVVERHEKRPVAEVLYGAVWLAAITFATSLMVQTSYEEGWLVFWTGVTVVTLAASRRLGVWVLGLGGLAGMATLFGSALSIAQAFTDSGAGSGSSFSGPLVADLAANLVVVATLCAAAVTAWRRDAVPAAIVHPLFWLAWLWSLAWVAAVLFQLGSPVNQVAISVVWAAAAGAAIIAAIVTADPTLRVAGLATLGTVLLKLAVVDLAEVETLWRVGLFLIIGLGLLRLGYVLPRLAERYGPRPDPIGPAGVPAQAR